MSDTSMIGAAAVKPDGGTARPPTAANHPFWELINKIWAARQEAGLRPRSVEEIEVERQRFRDEVEAGVGHAGQLQEECRRLRQQSDPSPPEE